MNTITARLWILCLLFITGVTSYSQYHGTNCADNRVVIAQMFEWKWADIAAECENLLGPMGYCGVQTSPAHENAVIDNEFEPLRPWWERYQPVSYKLVSRSGDEEAFRDMVQRCNNSGVRVYVDVLLNHMAAVSRSGVGTGGSTFDGSTGDFPGVPYSMEDFNSCTSPTDCGGCCCVDDWTNHAKVRDCRLLGLMDLDNNTPYVIDKEVEYLNHLIEIGVAGFRVDASKHMWVNDLDVILSRVNDLDTSHGFPAGSRPFVYHEVIDMNQNGEIRGQEYVGIGRVTDFRYGYKVKDVVGDLSNIGGVYDPGWGMLDPEDAFVFVDNHDTQRGHGPGGDVLTYKQPREYKMAQAITMGWNYGYPRMTSSYEFTDTDAGPPTHDGHEIVSPVPVDGGCSNSWVCEHRWHAVAGMASFAKAVYGGDVRHYWTQGNQAAWNRGGRGFVALTNHGSLDTWLQTGLPSGEYCDVIKGCPTADGCAGGSSVRVEADGMARVVISDSQQPIFAIHVDALAGSGSCIAEGSPAPTPDPTTPGPTTTTPPPGTASRTVVFLRAETQVGENVFLRGGIDHSRREGCVEDAAVSPCALTITHIGGTDCGHFDPYNDWKIGDTKLDWYGSEAGQGSFQGQPAEGSPAYWTTSDASQGCAYEELNSWGDHYWMLDAEMLCDESEDGWFELKSVIGQGSGGSPIWENDVTQDSVCQGTAGGSSPFTGNNHMARCGYVNVFVLNSGECTINSF